MRPRATSFNRRGCYLNLSDALISLKSEKDVANFMDILLTDSEKVALGNRIFIAMMLRRGKNYHEIKRTLKVGMGTIFSIKRLLEKNPEILDPLINRIDTLSQERTRKLEKEHRAYEYGTWEHFVASFKSYK